MALINDQIAKIAVINIGIPDEEVRKLKNYYNKGVAIDYPQFPTLLVVISSLLKQKGYSVKVFDLAIEAWYLGEEKCRQKLLDFFKKYTPDVIIVISKGYNPEGIRQIISLDDFKVRRGFPKYIFSFPAFPRDTAINLLYDFKKSYDIGEDNFVITYGEVEPFIAFLIKYSKKMSAGEFWKLVKKSPNIGYIDENGLVLNCTEYSDLTNLPLPTFDLVQAKRYFEVNNYIPLSFSRGCPYKCSHCPAPKIYGPKWRGLHLDKIHKLLRKIKDISSGRKNFMIDVTDRCLTYDLAWFDDLCYALNQVKIPWQCHLRPDWIDKEIIKRLSHNNCKRVILSADVLYDYEPTLAKFLGKSITLNSLKKASIICQREGIEVGMYFILDFYKRPENAIPEIMKKCNINMSFVSCFHDYIKFENSKVIPPLMERLINILMQQDSEITLCTGWGESSY